MIMIDWITARIPWKHSTPINNGNMVSISNEGEIQWSTEKWLSVSGSFESSIQVRSYHSEVQCSHIILSGNPSKFLQGHNLWGTDDLEGLLGECFFRVLSLLGISDFAKYPMGNVSGAHLTRVDLTAMYHLRDGLEVNNWLRAAEFSATTRHSGRGQMSNGTLYFGKNSRRWSIKFYHKGQEVKANEKHHRALSEELHIFADKSLRCEVTLRGMELEKMGLSTVCEWSDVEPLTVYNEYLQRLKISENMTMVDQNKLENLPPRLVAAFRCWENGEDMRELYPSRTFYRYRKQIMDAVGIDISVRQPSDRDDRSNVVPLIRVLEAKPADIPYWASGTDWYFEPNYSPTLRLAR